MPKKKAIIVSGYFNPIHKGHLEYINNAKALADKLFVIVNNAMASNQISDIIHWYKADINLPDFKLGAPWVWRLHKRYYTPDREEEMREKERIEREKNLEIQVISKANEQNRTIFAL